MPSDAPHPAAIERAMSAAMQVKATLYETQNTHPSDDPDAPGAIRNAEDRLLLDTLEGETDVFELIDRLAEQVIADELLVEHASERLKRIERRAARYRDVILRMLEALEVKKLERPLVTASVRYRTKTLITDPSMLPEAFMKRSPDLLLIARALKDGDVEGAEISNPMPSLLLKTT